jgi:hypothetical protein
MPPQFDEYGNPIIDINDPAEDPMTGILNDQDEPLPDIDPALFDNSGYASYDEPPLDDFGSMPGVEAPPLSESLPATGLRFDASVLAVQTPEEYDALAPELQEALQLIDSGVQFSEEALAKFVLSRREALQKTQTPEAQQAALKAKAGVDRVPPGYRLAEKPDGSINFQVVPGGPIARQRITYNSSVKTASGTVIEDVQKAMSLLDSAGRRAAGFGGLLSGIPESDSKQLQAYISSIQGNIGVDQLIKIKQTGAGLGQVPQSQLDLLSRLLGNLDQQQKPAELMDVFKRIDRIYTGIVDMADKEIQELSAADGGAPAAAAAAAPQALPTKTVGGMTYEKREDGKWHLVE